VDADMRRLGDEGAGARGGQADRIDRRSSTLGPSAPAPQLRADGAPSGEERRRPPVPEAARLFDRGLSLLADKLYSAALEEWERACALEPDNRMYQVNLKRLRERVFSGSESSLRSSGWENRISSARLVSFDDSRYDNPRYRRPARLVLYTEPNFRGRSLTLVDGESSLPGNMNRVRSVQVIGGTWQLCPDNRDRRPDNRVQRKWRAANNAITTRWTRKRRQNSQRCFSGQSAMASATVPTSINPDANSAMISAVENSIR
jgi:hypothetical protein